MKKAFTLIELLAVIIILAIVALVATPIILDVIEDARSSANKSSANMILSAARNYYAESMLDNNKKYNVENKQNIYDLVELNGNKPKDGKLYVNNEGKVAISVVIGNKCYVKNFNSELQELDKDDANCDLGYVDKDKQAPTITFDIIGNKVSDWYNESIYVTINVEDDTSGLDTYNWCTGLNCEPKNVESESKSLNLKDTETQVCAIAFDKAGNASEVACTEVLKIDTTKPVCEFNDIEYVGINSKTTLELSCVSNVSPLQEKELQISDFELNNSNISINKITKEEITKGYKYIIEIEGLQEGSTNIKLKENVFENEALNKNETKEKQITVNALSLSSISGSTLTKGYKLTSNIQGSNYGELSCKSENTSIASCEIKNKELVITPNATKGSTTITLTSENGLSVSYNVSVNDQNKYTNSILNGADPELDEGMIPVVINADGSLTKADIRLDWYNYTDKKWANAVLVSDDVRTEYKNMNTGEKLDITKVLAYYVWIPRYKYQIFNTKDDVKVGQTYGESSVQEIQIVFENKDKVKSAGSNKGEYVTHPAFTFGDDELNGIWVGKFETTGSSSKPTVLPNVKSLRGQNVSTQFKTSLLFANNTLNSDGSISHSDNNIYGINNIDAHMMKNIEWGATVYLTNSKYGRCTNGICEEVRENNSSSYITGCAATNPVLELPIDYKGYVDGCENAYNTSVGVLASTTKNVTGIYDMSGGAWEYVMVVIEDALGSGIPASGQNQNYNSGFIGNFTSTSGTNTEGIVFPESKYYDLYKYGTTYKNVDAYIRGQLGDATYELSSFTSAISSDGEEREFSNWNGDYAIFVYHDKPWLRRGGYWKDGAGMGIFAFRNFMGSSDSGATFRSVLVNK